MRFIESIFKMKLIKSAMIIVLMPCASIGYAGDGNTEDMLGHPDFSNCRVFQKIMGLPPVVKTVESGLLGPKKDNNFDDSKYSSSTDSSLDSFLQEGTSKRASDLYGSIELNSSMFSTQEFSPIQGRCKQSWSVESSAVFPYLWEPVVPNLWEPVVPPKYDVQWSEENYMSLLELLPDLAYRFNPRKSLDVYKSMSLEELLTEMKV